MFNLTSAPSKMAILTLSALAAVSAMESLVEGFHHPSSPSVVVALPSVTIIGYRTAWVQSGVQTASQTSAKSSI